ncbi:hypothetical protein HZR84_00650 [Hyphobacterium sp. CCMP332]|nr:hypothetical protein HZR84_00650 [Hyphobacterium sp. CCMP332]
MNLKEELQKEYSSVNSIRLAAYIKDHKNKTAELMALYSGKDQELAKRASWVLQHLHNLAPEQCDPFQNLIINTLKKASIHDAVKRSGLRTLADQSIDEENLGEVAEICFNFLNSMHEAVAVKVHAMEILKNIVKRIPELKEELLFSIEEQLPFQSSGFKNRASKILNFLNNL